MTKTQEIINKLNNMDLSEKARGVIASSDQFAIVNFFENCETAKDVEEIVNEYFDDEY